MPAMQITNRCLCGEYLVQHYVKDLACARPDCSCGHYVEPHCPHCSGSIYACGYDADNDICPEYERYLDERGAIDATD